MPLFSSYDRRSAARRAAQPALVGAAPNPAAALVDEGGAGAAPPTSASGAAVAAGTCSNCDAERVGEYCAHCGQHFLEDRLSFRLLASELWERVTFERGLLRTFREMMTAPGHVVRRYTQGQRRRYASPLTYLFLGAALSLLMFELYDDRMAEWVRANTEGLRVSDHAFLTPAQVEVHTRVTIEMARQTTYTGLALCALFAVFLRLFFRRSGVNLVESFVLALYSFGHVYYLSLPITGIAIVALDDVSTAMYAIFPLYLVVCCVTGAQYFGRPVRSAVKTAAALVASYFVFSFVVGTALLVYAMLSVREGISAPKPAAAAAAVVAPAAPPVPPAPAAASAPAAAPAR